KDQRRARAVSGQGQRLLIELLRKRPVTVLNEWPLFALEPLCLKVDHQHKCLRSMRARTFTTPDGPKRPLLLKTVNRNDYYLSAFDLFAHAHERDKCYADIRRALRKS